MEIHKTIVQRPRGWTNFIDFQDEKIVYRRYAGLFFAVCVDRGEHNTNQCTSRETCTH